MSRPVTVTRFAAKDGTLHDSAATADWHDRCCVEEARLAAVVAIVEHETWQGELSEFCGYQHTQQTRHFDENDYERRSRNSAIASIIIDRWDDLRAILAEKETRP